MRFAHVIFIFVFTVSLSACSSVNTTSVQPVSEAPGSSGAKSVTISVFGSEVYGRLPVALNADWLAVQDGDGAWRVVAGNSGKYRFEVTNTAGKYAVALACPKAPPEPSYYSNATSSVQLELRYLTLKDTDFPEIGCNLFYDPFNLSQNPGSLSKFSGIVKGIDSSELAFGQIFNTSYNNFRPNQVYVNANGQFENKVRSGKYTVLFGKFARSTVSDGYGRAALEKIILERDFQINSETSKEYDFFTESFNAVETNLRITGADARDYMSISSGASMNRYRISMSEARLRPKDVVENNRIVILPNDKMTVDDFHAVHVDAFRQIQHDQKYRFVDLINQVVPTNAILPGDFQIDGSAVANTPYIRPELVWNKGVSEYGVVSFSFSEGIPRFGGIPAGQRYWNVLLSSTWLGQKSQFAVPDLSLLQGWTKRWGFEDYSNVRWVASFYELNIPWLYNLDIYGSQRASISDSEIANQRRRLQDTRLSGWGYVREPVDTFPPVITRTLPPNAENPSTPPVIESTLSGVTLFFDDIMNKSSVEAGSWDGIVPHP
jgi:hypothetical protein